MIRLVLLAGTLLSAVALPVAAADWKMDAATSRLEFMATFERARRRACSGSSTCGCASMPNSRRPAASR